MKHVSILVPQRALHFKQRDRRLQSFHHGYNVLTGQGKRLAFNVLLVGLSNETILYNGLFVVRPEVLLQDVAKTDLIIIPAFQGEICFRRLHHHPGIGYSLGKFL